MESDLSVFHRIDDLTAIHPQRLIDLVVRLGYYAGVVQSILRREAAEDEPASSDLSDIRQDRVVESTAVNLALDPVLSGVIDLG